MTTEMKRRPRRSMHAVLTAGALVVLTACAGGGRPDGEPAATTEAGPLSWTIWLAPNPPEQEGTHLWLEVHDEDGDPVEGAAVEAAYFMPAMGAMAEMRGKGDVEPTGDGEYDIAFDFPMAGSWTIDIAVRSDAGSGTAEYTLTTGTRGLRQTGAQGAGGPDAVDPPGPRGSV